MAALVTGTNRGPDVPSAEDVTEVVAAVDAAVAERGAMCDPVLVEPREGVTVCATAGAGCASTAGGTLSASLVLATLAPAGTRRSIPVCV